MSENILTKQIAIDLVKNSCDILNANGYTKLSAESAFELSKFLGDELQLNSISELSREIAKDIAEFSGSFLCLNGLKEISEDAIKVLGTFKGEHLQLQGLTCASETTIEILCDINQRQEYTYFKPTLRLPKLNPPNEVIELLTTYEWDILELGLIEINPVNLQFLRHYDGLLILRLLDKINVKKSDGEIIFNNADITESFEQLIEEHNKINHE